MSSVLLALIICTGLCFTFNATRWLGILGVFVLVSLYPTPSIALLVLIGVIYLWSKTHEHK